MAGKGYGCIDDVGEDVVDAVTGINQENHIDRDGVLLEEANGLLITILQHLEVIRLQTRYIVSLGVARGYQNRHCVEVNPHDQAVLGTFCDIAWSISSGSRLSEGLCHDGLRISEEKIGQEDEENGGVLRDRKSVV